MIKIKVYSNALKEWYWIGGEYNPTDLGIREKAKLEDLRPGMRYQEGWEWMKLPENKANGHVRRLSDLYWKKK
jgi:hypothetical protein